MPHVSRQGHIGSSTEVINSAMASRSSWTTKLAAQSMWLGLVSCAHQYPSGHGSSNLLLEVVFSLHMNPDGHGSLCVLTLVMPLMPHTRASGHGKQSSARGLA